MAAADYAGGRQMRVAVRARYGRPQGCLAMPAWCHSLASRIPCETS